jgi:hypothetical protein
MWLDFNVFQWFTQDTLPSWTDHHVLQRGCCWWREADDDFSPTRESADTFGSTDRRGSQVTRGRV